MRTLLQIVQAISREMGLPQPTAVATTTDKQILKLFSHANREGKELSKMTGPVDGWPVLRKEQSIAIVAGTDNYAFPTDILRYINATAWDSNGPWRLAGPQTPQEWQFIKNNLGVSAIRYRFRIMAGRIYVDPVPTATSTLTIEYYSKNWVLAEDGVTTKEYFTLDTDTPILDDELIELGTKWRFLRSNGFSYDEEKNSYEDAVELALGTAGTGRDLNLGRGRQGHPHLLDHWNIPDTGIG